MNHYSIFADHECIPSTVLDDVLLVATEEPTASNNGLNSYVYDRPVIVNSRSIQHAKNRGAVAVRWRDQHESVCSFSKVYKFQNGSMIFEGKYYLNPF